MRRALAQIALQASLLLGASSAAVAQSASTAQTPLPIPNCNVDPAKTADPPAVARAQRDILDYLEHTTAEYSLAGYASAGGMIGIEGNSRTDWFNATLPLACGRLVGGYRGRNWVPGAGWQHADTSAYQYSTGTGEPIRVDPGVTGGDGE
ncbi:MAG: hypothetical protein IT307_12445 [Chloroflexi bacterium]|nr:hypothetical protein [Chloroflexota bacterium]